MAKLLFRVLNILFVCILIHNCSGGVYQKMALENPEALVALQDSLLQKDISSNQIKSLIVAHNKIGDSALEGGDYRKAIIHFSSAVQLSEEDPLLKYNLLIAEGHLLYKKGNKNGLWDAIQKYNRAAQLKPDRGDAHYYIGMSYHKIGDTEFDLIIESYEKALTLSLTPELRQKTEDALTVVLNREKRLKDFWK